MEKINKELLASIKILYVEDEKNISDQVKYFFERYVKEFHVANNGLEGLELYKEVNPDIIITDIQMPKMNGLEMLKQMGERTTPVIITTAYSDADYFVKAIELKVDKFVIKPINLVDLIQGVQKLVLKNFWEDKIYEKETLLKIVDQNVIMSITDKNGIILDASSAFCKLSGYSKEELVGNTHQLLRHEDTSDEFYKNMWEQIQLGRNFSAEIKNRSKSAEEYWTKLNITPVKKDGVIEKFVAIRQEITNKKKLETLAIEDDLTKIYNRRYFNKIINKEVRRVKRDNINISLLCIDIDHFKKFNDSYGHQKGDEILILIAKTLKSCMLRRATDYLFRVGGEEFCIIFSGNTIGESLHFAQEIVETIEKLEVEHISGESVTISAGLVVQSAQYLEDEDKLYKYADDALYKAKEQGRNQVVLSEHSR